MEYPVTGQTQGPWRNSAVFCYLLVALCRSTAQDAESWSYERRMDLLWHDRNEKCPFCK